MQSRFDFLAEQFPKLAEYGHKAEQALGIDNNICLLNLGRIAETITEILSNRSSIRTTSPDVLLEKGIIDENICLKIKTLKEIKDDAANNDYESESSASRMIAAAAELCEWFVSGDGVSRFAFLGDMFPENAPCPPLACLAEYGMEAEANLYSNTRYCFLCLGDIEEAITEMFLEMSGTKIPDNMEQHKKINSLLKPLGTDNSDRINVLHSLRQARNEAVHGRYDSQEAGRKLTEAALNLCEWVFMCVVSPGDFVRGSITQITEDGFNVSAGRICGTVPLEDIPPEKQGTYHEGERRVFRVTAKDSEGLTLSLSQAVTDPWTNMKRRYEKYKAEQILSVTVKRISENYGAFVSVGDSGELEARIPKSEYGPCMNPLKAKDVMRVGGTLKARVLAIDPEHYPYMLLSIEEAERENESSRQNDERLNEPSAKSGMPDREFLMFCREASHEEMIAALDGGANYNARSHFGTTPLMEASSMNNDLGAIKELIDAGANVNAKNDKGNTALIFAVMHNTPEVVRLLCENGADIKPQNNQGRDALSYALKNQKMMNAAGIIQLLTGDDAEAQERVAVVLGPKPKGKSVSDRQFIAMCKKGKEGTILSAIEGGANVNAKDSHGTTALIYASMFDIPNVVKALLERRADVNAVNNKGITALFNAVMNSRCENIEILLERGAEVKVANKKGKTLLEYAREKLSNKKCEYCLRKIEAALGLGDDTSEQAETPQTENISVSEESEASQPEEPCVGEEQETAQTEEVSVGEETEVLQTEDISNGEESETPQTEEASVSEEPEASQPEEPSVGEESSPAAQTPLSPEQEEEAARALRLTFQRDILKIARSGSLDDLAQAINSGVSLNVTNKSSATPLMFAAKSNSADIIDLLVKSGAALDAQDSKGNTPLIYAAAYNTDDVVEALLDAGADTTLKNLDGYSALDYAKINYRLIDTNALLRLQEDEEKRAK